MKAGGAYLVSYLLSKPPSPFAAPVPSVQSELIPPDREAESAFSSPCFDSLAVPPLLPLTLLLFFLAPPDDLMLAVVCLLGSSCRLKMAGRLRMPSLVGDLLSAPDVPAVHGN